MSESIIYEAQEGSALAKPGPSAEGSCPGVLWPEPCPEPAAIVVPSCQDAVRAALPEVVPGGLGRIVQLDVVLKSVCPGKRLAVSVILGEVDASGVAAPRGVKHILVPAQTGEECQDVTIKCIQFSLPEALDPSGDGSSLCKARNLQAQVIANYVDTDFVCCEARCDTV